MLILQFPQARGEQETLKRASESSQRWWPHTNSSLHLNIPGLAHGSWGKSRKNKEVSIKYGRIERKTNYFIRADWSWQNIFNTFRGKAGWDVPTQDQRGHWKHSGQGASWKPLCFFREIEIIKEDIILGSSVIYLLEFILQAVFYGKYLPKLSIEVFVCFVGCSESPMPRCNWKFTLICVGTRGLFSEFKASYKQLKLVARIPRNIQRNYKILLTKAGINGMFPTIMCNSS